MNRRVLAIATAAALAAAVAAPARAATVELRVESSTDPAPLFAGTVTTLAHAVDGGDGSGAHPCSGSPGAAASATATGALDDAMRAAGIPWHGSWNPDFNDFFVDSIGPFASAAPDRYWSLTVDGRFASGGCQARVEDGDSVHFFYGPLFGAAAPGGPATPDAAAGPRGPSGGGDQHAAKPVADPGRLAARAATYLRRNPDGAGSDWARLALALRSGQGLARSAGRLVPGRLGELRADGSLGGDVDATAVAVLALGERRPRAAAGAARWLASAQDASGGFGYRAGAIADVDSTGLAAWALARAGIWSAARRAAAFVRATQNADGGFPSLLGGASNSQSTGLALVALRLGGIGPRVASTAGGTPIDFLASLARRGGAIAYGERSNPTPVWTTAQALLGLTARSKLLATARPAPPGPSGRA